MCGYNQLFRCAFDCHDVYKAGAGGIMGDESSGNGAGRVALLAAVITGTAAILAALILVLTGAVHVSTTPGQTITVTATPSTTVTVTSPTSSKSTVTGDQQSKLSTQSNSQSPNISASHIPVLKPINQTGWVLDWHGQMAIGPQGVTITHSGPQASNGSDFTLQYIPGAGNGGWGVGNQAGEIIYWLNNYAPGSATINGIIDYGNYQGQNPVGTQANVGDRLCFEDEQSDIIVYMQVLRTSGGYTETDSWQWDAS